MYLLCEKYYNKFLISAAYENLNEGLNALYKNFWMYLLDITNSTTILDGDEIKCNTYKFNRKYGSDRWELKVDLYYFPAASLSKNNVNDTIYGDYFKIAFNSEFMIKNGCKITFSEPLNFYDNMCARNELCGASKEKLKMIYKQVIGEPSFMMTKETLYDSLIASPKQTLEFLHDEGL